MHQEVMSPTCYCAARNARRLYFRMQGTPMQNFRRDAFAHVQTSSKSSHTFQHRLFVYTVQRSLDRDADIDKTSEIPMLLRGMSAIS